MIGALADLPCFNRQFVLHPCARQQCLGETITDLDAFHGMDAHHRRCDARREPAIPMHVAAQPGWDVQRHALDHTSQRVLRLHGLPDQRAHLLCYGLVVAAHIACFGGNEAGRVVGHWSLEIRDW